MRCAASSSASAAAARATGAVLVADNATGEVLAYVGGIGGASTAPRGRRRVEELSPGGIDAQAVPLRPGDREGLSHPRLDPRRFAGPARHRLGALRAAELRQGVQGAGVGAQRAGGLAQRAGGAHLAARRSRRLPRSPVGHRLSRAHRGRRLLRLQPRARIGRGAAERAGRRLSQPRARRALVAASG